jgi:hypothetical protein
MGDRKTTQAPEETKKALAELQKLVDDTGRGGDAGTSDAGASPAPTPSSEAARRVSAAPAPAPARSGCASCAISSRRDGSISAWWLVAWLALLRIRGFNR